MDQTTNNKHVIYGTIKEIMEPKQISQEYTKHEFVLTTDEKYPNDIIFAATGSLVDYLPKMVVGDKGTISFNIGGKKSGDKYWNSLKAWRFDKG